MDMNINGELVKLLRTQHAWSQEELAAAADLSLRTVQRIESANACSLESKKALAAVFEIEARSLEVDEVAVAKAIADRKGKLYGYIGVSVGWFFAYAAVTYSLLTDSMSLGEAGIAYGLIGLFCGICGSVIGMLARTAGNS